MKALFAHGAILDYIIAATILEAAALIILHRRTALGIPPAAFLPNLAAGLCLLLAMRLALAPAWWGYISAALLAALCCHVIDLARQWRR